MARATARTEKLDIRLTPTAKHILQTAAIASSRSVSEFVVESALARAAETLPDRTRFNLDAEAWKQFQAALDAPPKPVEALRKLMTTPSVFETPSA